MPTLKDIANEVGVSASTVSRVMNNDSRISADTRSRVMEAVQRLGYSVNLTARALATDRTSTLCLIQPKLESRLLASPVSQFQIGASDAATERHQLLIPLHVDEAMMADANKVQILQHRRPDGLIIGGPIIRPQFIIDLCLQGHVIVLVDNRLEGLSVDCVVCDNEGGTYAGTRHLILSAPHKQIVFLSGPSSWLSSRERYLGYEAAMLEARLSPEVIYLEETTIDAGRAIMPEVLDRYPQLTGIVAVNDAVAWGAGQYCQAHGIRIPHDIGIVGFDNQAWAELHNPPLTTVNMNDYELGYQAVKCLLDRLDRPHAPTRTIRVATELIVRGSSVVQG